MASPWADRSEQVLLSMAAHDRSKWEEARKRLIHLDAVREIYPRDSWFREVLATVQYKPGWAIYIHEGHREDSLELRINLCNPNAYPDRIYTEDGIFRGLSRHPFKPLDFKTAESFVDWVFYRLLVIELHESREFFRFQGHPIYDPHIDGPFIEPLRREMDHFPWKDKLRTYLGMGEKMELATGLEPAT